MSIKKRVLVPIVAVASAGLVASVLVGAAALHALRGESAVIEKSLASIEHAGRVGDALEQAQGVLEDVIGMTRMIEAETSINAFTTQVSAVETSIDALFESAQSAEMTAGVQNLADSLALWVADARVVLGADPASEIPTVERIDRGLATVSAASEGILALAQEDASRLSAEAANAMLLQLALVGAVMLVLMGAALAFALRSANRVSAAVVGVAADLRALSDDERTGAVAGDQSDEIAAMQGALGVLREGLAEKEELAARERAEQEARLHRAELAAAFQARLQRVVDAARDGDFSERLDASVDDPDLRAVAERMNTLLGGIEHAVTAVSGVLKGLSRGDLSVRMSGQFSGAFADLQRDAEQTCRQLSDLVARIAESSGQIRHSVGSIATGSQSLSDRTEAQAASLQMTASTMEELAATVRSNVEGAEAARAVSSGATEIAIEGVDAATAAVSSIRLVDESAQQISEITSLVDGIAFQTNLLALNAAIEAARAGEAGKGFAVVATEVRTLAERAGEAAREINALVTKSSDQVADSVRRVEAMGELLEGIRKSIAEASASVSEIVSASAEQSNGIESVTSEVSHLDGAIQQNAALASESASTAQTLAEQARQLSELIAFFNGENRDTVSQAA